MLLALKLICLRLLICMVAAAFDHSGGGEEKSITLALLIECVLGTGYEQFGAPAVPSNC